MMTDCPCGSGKELEACCAPYLNGVPAPSPEALMRSRFTAFVQDDIDYIERTHATEVHEDFNRSAAEATARSVEWVSLKILDTGGGGEGDAEGVVEFAARFKKDGELMVHHERSNFRRENGAWCYVDGQMNPKSKPRQVDKIGRNDPCPCGSGKKYKKCCGT